MSSHYINHKVTVDGYGMDSKAEKLFYLRFVKPSGRLYHVHPIYHLLDMFPVGGVNMGGMRYTPDFVIFNDDGTIAHVYDVKASFSQYSVSTAARQRFTLFAHKFHIPVECVIVRKHDFRVKMFNITTHPGEYVRDNVNYDLADIIGQ